MEYQAVKLEWSRFFVAWTGQCTLRVLAFVYRYSCDVCTDFDCEYFSLVDHQPYIIRI